MAVLFLFFEKPSCFFHNGCNNLHSYQQCTRVSFSTHPHQHLSSLVFWVLAILIDMNLNPTVILICTSLMTRDVECLFMWLLTICFLLWKKKMCFQVFSPFLIRLSFSSVQSLSRVQLFATPWISARQASLSITNSLSSPRLMCIESVMPSSHLILCRPLLLLPPIPPSIKVFPMSQLFTSGGQSTGVSASASVLPMNTQDLSPSEWTGWISLQSKGLSRVFSNTHSSKTSYLWCSAFFTVQLSHPYMTTGKTIALTRRTFVGKVRSLLFNMLSRSHLSFQGVSVFWFHGCNQHLQWFWSPPK